MSLAKLSSEERRWVFSFALFLIVLTSIPYALAFASQGGEWVFSGFLIGVEDGNSYIAKMLTGAQGAWLFRSPYSALEQQGTLLYLPYLLLGKLAGPSASHLTLVGLYQLFRVAAVGLLCFATYEFFTLYIQSQSLRRLALILATLGGGLGWLLLAIGQANWLGSLPLDFYSPESFGFLAIFGLPHLSLARALLLWGLVGYLRAEPASSWSSRLRIVLFWLSMALVHLLALLIGFVLFALHLALMRILNSRQADSDARWTLWKRHLSYVLWAAMGAVFPLFYNAFVYFNDAYVQAWAAQNLILSPHPLHYLLAYGLLLPFVFFGARHLLHRDFWRALLPLAWLAILPIMLYVPFGVQRRLADGVWLALIALALAAFETPSLRNRQNWRWLFTAAFPSTLLLLVGSSQLALDPQLPAFRPANEVKAFEALRSQADAGELLLSSFGTGNALPAWAPLRVLVGHGPETVGLGELLPRVSSFYNADTPNEESQMLLQEFGIDYVFWGPTEQYFGDWQPNEMQELILRFKGEAYSIYQYTEN